MVSVNCWLSDFHPRIASPLGLLKPLVASRLAAKSREKKRESRENYARLMAFLWNPEISLHIFIQSNWYYPFVLKIIFVDGLDVLKFLQNYICKYLMWIFFSQSRLWIMFVLSLSPHYSGNTNPHESKRIATSKGGEWICLSQIRRTVADALAVGSGRQLNL